MKPVIELDDVIMTSMVNPNHLVVGINKRGEPLVLGKAFEQDFSDLIFYLLHQKDGGPIITTGNGVDFSNAENTLQKMIEKALKNGFKIAVFKSEDWKEALKWMIENG